MSVTTYIIENKKKILCTSLDILQVNILDNNRQCNEPLNLQNRWIIYLSVVTLPQYVISVLKLGEYLTLNEKLDNKIILEMIKNLELYLNKSTDFQQTKYTVIFSQS